MLQVSKMFWITKKYQKLLFYAFMYYLILFKCLISITYKKYICVIRLLFFNFQWKILWGISYYIFKPFVLK